MGDHVPNLPLEVLSIIAALVPPPFYPSNDDEPPASGSTSQGQPTTFVIESLDPRPTPSSDPTKFLATLSRTSHTLLEASRPWLWEEVDVRSGRGWLSVVNALTEEVHDDDENLNRLQEQEEMQGDQKENEEDHGMRIDGLPLTPVSPPRMTDGLPPVPAVDAHMRPVTIPGGSSSYQPYVPTRSYPHAASAASPIASSSTPDAPLYRTFTYSPPQPPHLAMLLTPPGSRNASPSPHPDHRSSPLPLPPLLKSPTSATSAKLRGRSRSPRRSINFDTEGISAVLDRSRSLSSNAPRRIPLERRRSSLSRARTMANIEDEDVDEDADYDEHQDEDEDELMPLGLRGASLRREISPPTAGVEESWENVNPELLPMPGPYIRHLSFTNFKTIGSRRSQEEAVRGRFVTAGRLEGVIKVCHPHRDLYQPFLFRQWLI